MYLGKDPEKINIFFLQIFIQSCNAMLTTSDKFVDQNNNLKY